MEAPQKTALVLGATGLVGNKLIELLLEDQRYATVKIFGRRKLDKEHPKLQQYVGDLLQFEGFEKDFKGDEVFCCIGTTKAKTPDQATYRKIDYGIPLAAAQLAKKRAIETFFGRIGHGVQPQKFNFL